MGEFTWAYINGALTASGPTGSIQFRGDNEGCFATLSGSPNLRYLTGSQPEHGGNAVGILELTGNLNISGNLNIAGSFTTISSSNLIIQDPVIGLAFGSGAHASTVTGGVGDRGFIFGLIGNLNQALIWDQSSGSFVIGKVGSHGPDKTAYDVPFPDLSTFRAGVFQAVGNDSQAKPTLSITHLEDTNDAVEIIADAVTTAKVVNISADALTTGIGLQIEDNSSNTGDHHVVEIHQTHASAVGATALAVTSSGGKTGMVLRKQYSNTTAASVTGLILDFDKTGASTSNNTLIGAQIDMDNATATNGVNQMIGVQVTPTLTHAADAGTTTVIGAEITATGHTNGTSNTEGISVRAVSADKNVGVKIFTTDVDPPAADNADIIIASSADEEDLCYIAVGASGVTTIATVDSDAAVANLTLDADGKIIIEAVAGDEAVFNEGGLDVDFRVEAVDETHMIFVEGSTNRVSIGDSVDSPAATLEITNHASAGAYNVPLVQLNNNDVDQFVLDITAANTTVKAVEVKASNTTSNVIEVTGSALTTGGLLHLQSNSSDTGNRTLLSVINDNTAATGVQMVHLKNDAIGGAGDPILLIESTAAETDALLELKNDNAATDKPPILTFHSTGSSADDMSLGAIKFHGVDAANNPTDYVSIDAIASDVVNGDEGGKLTFNVFAGGTAGTAASANLFSIGGEDASVASTCEVAVNDAGVDCNFRVESDGETHMLFVDGGANRVSIGDDTDGPSATLEVTNANHANFNTTLVQLNNNEDDQIALDINAVNTTVNVVDITADAVTTAKVLEISADALTTGVGLHIEDNSSNTGDHHVVEIKQTHASALGATALAVSSSGGKTGMVISKGYTNTSAASVTGLILDFDKTGASTSNNTLIGMQLDMDNATATNGVNQMIGVQVTPTLTHAADAGTTTVIGGEFTATGHSNGTSNTEGISVRAVSADKNLGVKIVTTDHTVIDQANADFVIASSADEDDHFSITVGTAGATTIRTVEDAASAANLLFEVDGNISASANHGANPFQIQASQLKLLNTPLSSSEDIYGTSLRTSGNCEVSGNLILSGNANIGNHITDLHNISGSLHLTSSATNIISGNLQVKGTAPELEIASPTSGLGYLIYSQGGTQVHTLDMGSGGALNYRVMLNDRDMIFRGKTGGTAYESFRLDSSAKQFVVNYGDDSVDLRVAGDNDAQLLFVDATSDAVGIGVSAAVPDAVLDIEGDSAQAKPTLSITHAEDTNNAVDIVASSLTTANVLNITADDSLTTGKVIAIDHNDAATTAVGPIGISYDFDKDGVTADTVTSAYTGVQVNMADAATNHAGSTVVMTGIDLDVDSASTAGSNINIGLDLKVTDATENYGIVLVTEDGGTSADIVMKSDANQADYSFLAVGANGQLTMQTVDASGGPAANLAFVVDGNISASANNGANSFQLQSSNFGVTVAGDVDILRSVGVGVPVSASLGMNVHHNPTSLKISTGGGEVVAFGTESPLGANALVAGYLYCMQDDGDWCLADADLVISSSALLGIALGGAVSDGILLQGYFHCATASVSDHHVIGQPCYISEDAGHIDFIAPSAAGDTVRVIGYGTPVANLIYFNPDNTWIEL